MRPPGGPLPGTVDGSLLRGMLLALLILAAAGAILLSRLANPAGNAMAVDRAMFASVNALTLTGFELAPTAVHDLQPAGQWTLAALTLAGTLFCLVAGGSLLSSLLGLGYSRPKIIAWAAGCSVCLSLLGAGFLMQPGESFSTCLMAALGSFGNCGLAFSGPSSIWDWRLHGVVLPLSVLGGLGLPVLIDLAEGIAFGRALSPWSRRMITLCGLAYLGGLALMLLAQLNSDTSGRQWLITASAASLDARSLGLPVSDLPLRLPAVAWSLMLLMLLGAAPGGTAGGLRLTSVAAVLRGGRALLRGEEAPRELGIALGWIGSYVLMLACGVLLLLMYEPGMSADRLVFLVVSAIGNVGLSHDPVNLTGTGLYLLSLCMLAGRLAPLLFAWRMLQPHRHEAVVA